MIKKSLLSIAEVPDNLIANLENRDTALWIRGLPESPIPRQDLLTFLGLPWRLVVSEISNPWLINSLEDPSKSIDYLTRKRGFIQVIDSDPARIQLPRKCLPFYLLHGKQQPDAPNDFEAQLRLLTILESVRRSAIREILIISGDIDPIPPAFEKLWASGFRTRFTIATDHSEAKNILEQWVNEKGGLVSFSRLSAAEVIDDILKRYTASYPEDRFIVRVRDKKGEIHNVDLTEIDEPENPILGNYSLITDRDLSPLQPEELTKEAFISFFENPQSSWRPYAARLPWIRSSIWKDRLDGIVKKIDSLGPGENSVAYITSEAGAGGTTVARALAWDLARDGYPTLIAKPIPFVPDSLPISNFLLRAHRKIDSEILDMTEKSHEFPYKHVEKETKDREPTLYEAPWVLVYDKLHWECREDELRKFCRQFQKDGRPVLILVVTDSIIERAYSEDKILFKHVGKLNHILSLDETRELGRHLNKFLRVYGLKREEWQWDKFYEDHTIRLLRGSSSFWITLSFWIQGQYDMTESIQAWMYRSLKDKVKSNALIEAIFLIAVMSSERLPLPEELLPEPKEDLPLSYYLDESRSSVPAIGLMPIKENGTNYWALVHDILGRFLINALYYDKPLMKELGLENAKDPEHLRFLILRRISERRELGEKAFTAIAENFATFVFKIDPDHGRANFAHYWSEVLDALDKMPQPLYHGNRVFLHHTAISRRRIAKLDELVYGVKDKDRRSLLERAIHDVKYALSSIDYTAGSETNLNLYNTLARAYLDLANVELRLNASDSRIADLRKLASDATRKAYRENPTNSHVIETYVNNLLINAKGSSDQAIDSCIEALGILFAAMSAGEEGYRLPSLGSLADEALEILFKQTPPNSIDREPASAIDVLIKTWMALSKDIEYRLGIALSDIPETNRKEALAILAHPKGRGNIQILQLNYQLICVTYPREFKKQLEYLEQLEKSDYRVSPQQKLEYAILLYQNNRADEGARVFRFLRQLWRDSEQYVRVPNRLRWLWAEDGITPLKVTGFVVSDFGFRAMAKVKEFARQKIPFRPIEFSLGRMRSGSINRIVCYVSFGHNGPFLRPLTSFERERV